MDIELIKRFTRVHLKDEKTGHNYYHGQRVANSATKTYLSDYPNAHGDSRVVAIIQTGSYLHNTIDERTCENPSKVIAETGEPLPKVGFTELEAQDTLFTIQHVSFSDNIEHHCKLPLSGQYARDADRIESLGAIRIVRTFTYDGKHGNKVYGPEIKPEKLVSHDRYRNRDETTIDHFYEKLPDLGGLIGTPAAKKEAHRRTEYMREFVQGFMDEWSI